MYLLGSPIGIDVDVSVFDGTIILFDPKADDIPLTGRTEEVTHIKKSMTDKQVVTQDVKGQPKNSH